jgi:hypothetical protein
MPNSAPSVEIFERSFSQNVAVDSATVFGTMGLFSRGPVNELTLLTSPEELREVFGTPVDDVTAKFFYPVDKILEISPVYVIRVENQDKKCAGSIIGISGTEANSVDAPVEVKAYPLSYTSIYESDEESDIQIDLDALDLSNAISVIATGPGESYENVGYSIVNYDDYAKLQDLAADLASSDTDAEIEAVGETAYNAAVSGSGISDNLVADLIDPNDEFSVDSELLNTYLSFEFGPTSASQFAFYEYDGSSLVNQYLVSVDPEEKDARGESIFANNIVNETSTKLRVFVGSSKLTAANVDPVSTPKVNLGGADALTTNIDSTIDDAMVEQLILNFSSREEFPNLTAFVDLDFGLSVKQKMNAIAVARKDTVALLNVAGSTMIDTATSKKKANQTKLVKQYADSTLGIDSSYAALYANYFEVRDRFNNENVWIPATGHVANKVAFTIENFAPWFAVAGFERGVITGDIRRVAFNPNEEQRKVLYPARVNAIVNFRGEGIVIFGQKTLQSFASNTDRLDIRMLLIDINKTVRQVSRQTLFAKNTANTRRIWRNAVTSYLDGVLANEGISEYDVIADETNNPDAVVARKEFYGYIAVRPVNSIEFIKIYIADVSGELTIAEALDTLQANNL